MSKQLVAILNRCDIPQQAIADQLGVSRATVSNWASGKRQMTSPHHLAVLEWAYDAQHAALAAAQARDAAMPEARRTVLNEHRYEQQLKSELEILWQDYWWERRPTQFNAGLIALFRRWAMYAEADPETLTLKPADLDRLWEDTRQIRAWIATQRRLHPDTPPLEEPEHAP